MYFSARKSGAPAFVGPLDALIAQGATLRHASSVRRLLSSYTGAACRLREDGTNTEANIPFLANGALDLNVVDNLRYVAAGDDTPPGGFSVSWVVAYDQSGSVNNAEQIQWGSQPVFLTSVMPMGAMQGTGTTGRFLDVNLGATANYNNRPFFVLAVVNVATTTSIRILLGNAINSIYYIRQSSVSFQSAWPISLANSIGGIGKKTLGAWVNSAASTNYLNGVYQTEGNTGSDSLDSFFSSSRIGRGSVGSTSWFNTNNHAISEFLVFNNDPTLLPGWPAFVAAQNAYFGIV
jgi:hypothetical protein